VTRRHVPNADDAFGFLGLLFLAILLTMGLAMCETSTIPQGFAP
jgi:hypothetical protein